jgi:hypothetical protein
MDMVSEFMGEHGFNLIRGEGFEKGIPQQDAAGLSYANQRGIGSTRPSAQINGVDPLGSHSSPFRQQEKSFHKLVIHLLAVRKDVA